MKITDIPGATTYGSLRPLNGSNYVAYDDGYDF